MKNRDLQNYSEQDEDAVYQRRREFRVPFIARIVGAFFSTVTAIRFNTGRLVGKLLFGTRIVDRLAGVKRFFVACLMGIRRSVDGILMRTVFSQKTEDIVTKSQQGVSEKIQFGFVGAVAKVSELSERSTTLRWLLMPVRWLLIPAKALFDFSVRWLFTREFKQLLFSLPAIGLMIPMLICLIMIPLRSNQAKARHYMRSLDAAAKNNDIDTANLLHKKISALQDSRPDSAWRLAMMAAEEEDYQEAYRHMQTIAPVDRPGVAGAHLWIARSIVLGLIQPDGDPREEMKSHLDQVLSMYPKNEMALKLMADHHLSLGDGAKSLEILDQIDAKSEIARLNRDLQKATTLLQTGDHQQAGALLDDIVSTYKRIHGIEGQQLNVAAYQNWSFALQQSGLMGEAIRTIELGLEEHPDSEQLLTVLNSLRIKLVTSGVGAALTRFEIAKKLLESEPDNPKFLSWIADFSANADLKDRALDILQPKFESDSLPVGVLDRMARAAMIRHDDNAARLIYRKVLDKDDKRPIPLNNLAWILAHNEPIELDKALELIDKAIALVPDNPSLRATRGHIFMRRSNWDDAIRDLEFGLNGMPNNRKAHAALAQAYTKLGKADMAERHSTVLDQLPPEPPRGQKSN